MEAEARRLLKRGCTDTELWPRAVIYGSSIPITRGQPWVLAGKIAELASQDLAIDAFVGSKHPLKVAKLGGALAGSLGERGAKLRIIEQA